MDEFLFAPPKKPWNDSIASQIPTSNGFPWFHFGGFCPSTVAVGLGQWHQTLVSTLCPREWDVWGAKRHGRRRSKGNRLKVRNCTSLVCQLEAAHLKGPEKNHCHSEAKVCILRWNAGCPASEDGEALVAWHFTRIR